MSLGILSDTFHQPSLNDACGWLLKDTADRACWLSSPRRRVHVRQCDTVDLLVTTKSGLHYQPARVQYMAQYIGEASRAIQCTEVSSHDKVAVISTFVVSDGASRAKSTEHVLKRFRIDRTELLVPHCSQFRPHRMDEMRPIAIDDPVEWCVRLFGTSLCPAKNGWTDRGPVCDRNSWGPRKKKHCITWGSRSPYGEGERKRRNVVL